MLISRRGKVNVESKTPPFNVLILSDLLKKSFPTNFLLFILPRAWIKNAASSPFFPLEFLCSLDCKEGLAKKKFVCVSVCLSVGFLVDVKRTLKTDFA